VPAHVSGLILQAQPGAELACRAHNYNLPPGEAAQPRGILSYYAAATLTAAHSMGDWMGRIEAKILADVEARALPAFYRPDLQMLGNAGQFLPGAVYEEIDPELR
jgi:hypothetical protein